MILAMMVCYVFLLHLIFNVFKLVQATTRNKIYVTIIGCFMIYCMLLVINYYQPMSTDLRVYRAVVPLRTGVTGIVEEVVAKPNVPLKKGDLVFRLDPAPFRAKVARLKAQLVAAEQQAKMLPVQLASASAAVARSKAALLEARQTAESLQLAMTAADAEVQKLEAQVQLADAEQKRQAVLIKTNATSADELQVAQRNLTVARATLREAEANRDKAQLALDSQIDGVNTVIVRAEQSLVEARSAESVARLALESTVEGENTTVARIRSELASAEIDLQYSEVRAPADGYVINLALRPGQVIRATEQAVVTFVNAEEYSVTATFHQQVLGLIEPGDEVELALDDLPGRTLRANVKNINQGIPQGQVLADGTLLDTTPLPHGRFLVQFSLEDDTGLTLPPGAAGAATVYTQYGRSWIPVRKVFFRWYTWLNYIMTDMDVVGPRQ